MKSKKTKRQAAAPATKSKPIEKLRLNKETLDDLSAKEPGPVKGGGGPVHCTRMYSGCRS